MFIFRMFTPKTRKNISFALSLCLLIAALLPAAIINIYADDEESSVYTYSVEVSFGSLSFYYDYGIWDVNTLADIADSTSVNPAADTEQGFPGWYGFDGTANKISVEYIGVEGTKIEVTVSYTNSNDMVGISMSGYHDKDFTSKIGTASNEYVYDVANGDKTVDTYVSFSGKPLMTDGKYFYSTSEKMLRNTGLLKLQVSAVKPVND